MATRQIAELAAGFSKLGHAARLKRLQQMGLIDQHDLDNLTKTSDITLADTCIENAIGMFAMPLGVAANFRIDNIDYMIPMAVEETSIIAGASKMAKWIQTSGELTTQTLGHTGIGQIQFPSISNDAAFHEAIENNQSALIEKINNDVLSKMCERGGGLRELSVRSLLRPDGKQMAVVHLHIDTCDAMGANLINKACEALKEPLEALTSEQAQLCILSNLCDTQCVRASITLRDVPDALGLAIQEASLFAGLDPYRAATHNKGIQNGIDPIVIATGNDWRAVEAGAHAYACRDGQYRSLSSWHFENGTLRGELTLPMQLGTVGGVTKLHPMAQLSLKILGHPSKQRLGEIATAVGLAQNLAALRALCEEGINQGHMKLHIKNFLLALNVQPEQSYELESRLQAKLIQQGHISLEDAKSELKEMQNSA